MPHSSTLTTIGLARNVCHLSLSAIHIIMAMRLCVMCHKSGHDPEQRLAERFGSPLAAQRFRLAVEVIGQGWPEPFLVSRLCCPHLTPDEALLADMVAAVGNGDRAAFDRVSCDMVCADVRERIFASLIHFRNAWETTATTRGLLPG